MNYFFLAFFLTIFTATAFGGPIYNKPLNTENNIYHIVVGDSQAACLSAASGGAISPCVYSGGWYSFNKQYIGDPSLQNVETHSYTGGPACPTGETYLIVNNGTGWTCGVAVVVPPDNNCSATNTASTCICSDGQPKTSGQYTTCDRPALIYCDVLSRATTPANCPLLVAPHSCPTDTNYNADTDLCENKCAINAHYNAMTNKCEANAGTNGDNTCPSGYTADSSARCIPNSCPTGQKVFDGVCAIDTDPKTDTDTTIDTANDGTSTETTITTITTNNADGSTTTVTNTTVTSKDATGAVTSVDSSSTENTTDATQKAKDEEDEPKVTGGNDCITPPACSGDALQCGQIHQLWEIKCRLPEPKAEEVVENANECAQTFVCDGGIIQCSILEAEKLKMCSDSAANLTSLIQSTLPAALAAAGGVGSNGFLNSAQATEFDIAGTLGIADIFATAGAAGACPANYTFVVFGTPQEFNYEDFICPTVRQINPLIIFFATMFCSLMLYRAVEGL